MEIKDIGIIAQVVYKEHAANAFTTGQKVNFVDVKKDTQDLMAVIEQINKNREVPFNSQPAPTSNGQVYNGKAVGMPCKDCSTPMIQGKKGPYCKPCYMAWKNSQS